MLEPIGITPSAEALYLRLVESYSIPLPAPAGVARADIASLVEAGLAVELRESYSGEMLGEPTRLAAVLPDEGVGRLLLAEEQRINDERDRLLKMRREFAALRELFEASRGESENSDLVQVLAGRDEVGAAFETVLTAARYEYSVFETGYFGPEPGAAQVVNVPAEHKDFKVLRHRTIYDEVIFASPYPEFVEYLLAESRACGEIQRLVPRLPLKMVLADECLGLVALTRTGVDGAMLVRSKRLLLLLRDVFESMWESASPLVGGDAQERAGDPYGQIPSLLAAGFGDEAIARQLGVGLRTVRRRIAEMSNELDAHSRFQAGVLAEKNGLVRQPG